MKFITQKVLKVRNLSLRIWGEAVLPVSKSESNRLLIIEALSGGNVKCGKLSEAKDTVLMQAALASDLENINIEDAGTAMRFLTAYYCVTNQHKILTGSARMQERPISILVEALSKMGFDIRYLKKEGFPPLEIMPVDVSALKSEVEIAGNISSQYISALLLISPLLSNGLKIIFTTSLVSKPYIALTLDLLDKAGIKYTWDENSISIKHQAFSHVSIDASADWSAAGYWFSMASLAEKADIKLKGLTFDSAQGDKVIAKWCEHFGVISNQEEDGISLYSNNPARPINPENPVLHFDFTDYPDLAQTMIVLCAAKNVNATFAGLESLRIKETDRIVALQTELMKFGVKLYEINKGIFGLSGTFAMSPQTIQTYDDHRMAMAFAPLALLGEITIENPEVVEKSYPNFWKEMEKVGFEIV